MRIKEVINYKKNVGSYENLIDECKEDISKQGRTISRFDLEEDDIKDDLVKLDEMKKTLKKLKKEQAELKCSIPEDGRLFYNRQMLGTEVAKLMSEINGRDYIYLEDYKFEIDDQSGLIREFKHVTLVRKKVFTIVNKHLAPHEPYTEYYDEETIRVATDEERDRCSEYNKSKLGYKNTYQEQIDNQDLFFVPFIPWERVGYGFDDDDRKEYLDGNTVIEFCSDEYTMYFDHETCLNDYHEIDLGYNKTINDFLTIVMIKSLIVGRNLTEEEIGRLRAKFIELYNSGYSFEYYEDDLYELEDVKVIKKNIEK